MAKEEVVIKLTVDAVNSAQSVKELKQIIRDANTEALKFKQGSAEFANFANIAAQAKDKLSDFREQMQLLDPDAKIRAFTGLGNAIVGGFTAAQGAAALFGAEAEDVQKALLKVQGAMALLQGFQAIQDGAKSFKLLKATIIESIATMGALKAALIATGIGALSIIIGTIAANWTKFKESIELSFPAFGKVTEFFSKFQEIAFGALSSVVAGFKQVGAVLNDIISFQFGKAISDAKDFPKVISESYNKAVEIFNRPDLPEAIDTAVAAPVKKSVESARADFEKLKEDIDWIFGEAINKHIEFNEQSEELRKKNVEGANSALQERIKNEKIGLIDDLGISEKRIELEKNVFAAVTQLGNLGIKNQQKLEQFQRKAAAVNIIIAQAESLANAVKAVKFAVTPIDYAIQIAAAATSVFAIFAQIKSLFSKAGSSGGGVSLDTGGGSFNGGISSNTPTGVNFLNQPQTTLTPPPPNNQQPIIIQNIISESDITNTQKKVNTLTAQATIG